MFENRGLRGADVMIEVRTDRADEDKEILALCALAAVPRFSSEIGRQIRPEVWTSDWTRLVAGWIGDHIRRYGSMSIGMLRAVVRERSKDVPDRDTAEAARGLARTLALYYDDHSESFSDYKFLRDVAMDWLRTRNLEVLRDAVEDALDCGRTQAAEKAVRGYTEVRKVETSSVDLLRDVGKIAASYEDDSGVLFAFPGELGRMTGAFQRGDLFLIMAESGAGKSWMAVQVAYEAFIRGLSVLYVNLEISESQMVRRFYSALCGRPRQDMVVDIPRFSDAGGVFEVESSPVHMDGVALDPKGVETALRALRMGSNGGRVRLVSEAPRSMTVRDLEHEMDDLREFSNFVPDVLVVDYGDLLRPENPREDKRVQTDEVYLGLRRIALDRNILVVSPTQSNRDGYGKDVRKQNMSENIGNVNHCAVLWGMSHSPKEKEMGITRVRVLKNRDNAEYADPAVCVGSLDIGRIVMDSKSRKLVRYKDD